MNTIRFINVLFLAFVHVALASKPKNVLFLVADDMRPNLGAYKGFNEPLYSEPEMHTPNLDALAAKSLLFNNAFDQESMCSPSRTSLLTGRRIDTTRVTQMDIYWREMGGNFTTIPQYFKEHGYFTTGAGKVFHPGPSSNDNDQEFSWSEKYHHCGNKFRTVDPGHNSWFSLTDAELEENDLEDIVCADYITEKLRELAPKAKSGEQPFFIAMGMKKPHLPWYFPERYFEYYPEDQVDLPYNPNSPTGLPDIAWHPFRMMHYDDCTPEAVGVECIGEMNCTYPDWKIKEQRRAYYAAVTHSDNELGRVLDELKNLGLEDDTIVSFWSDHGYTLGEHAEWTKKMDFDIANRVPFMVRIPGKTDNGLVSDNLVELVDLMPTLIEAAGFDPLDTCPQNSHEVQLCSEGSSLMPLFQNPERSDWKDAVFWQMPKGKFNEDELPEQMGYSIRTDEYRYTEYVNIKFPTKGDYYPDWEDPADHEELYDLTIDPQENWNRYDDPEYFEVKEILSERLHAGWYATKSKVERK